MLFDLLSADNTLK